MRVRSAASLLVLSICGLWNVTLAGVEATDGWSRETVPGTTVGAGYITLRNTGTTDSKLLKISTPAAESVELHQSSVDAQGVAHMWPMASLELKPGETVRFAPGGRHLMLIGLKEPLRAGAHIPLTLQFNREDPAITVMLVVRPLGAGDTMPGMAHH